MAAIANSIDFMAAFFAGNSSKLGSATDQCGLTASIKLLYVAFAFIWFVTFGVFSDSDFSATMTAGTCFQTMGFCMLCAKVRSSKSVEGLSSQSLLMFALFYCFRLTSTTMKDGYIPVDQSGDFMLQTFEASSLLCTCYLLYAIHKVYPYTYQEEHDTMPIMPLIAPCIVLGCFVHGDFNKNRFFDCVWAISLNFETFVLLPQLWMMAKMGGKVDRATSQFVVCTILSCVCRFTFWVWAYDEQTTTINAMHILIAHSVQMLFCADFLYYYVQAWFNGSAVMLPTMEGTVEM
jgi:hypothetical protein